MKPKQHTQTSNTGERGVNLIGGIVLRMGHAWNPVTMDAGIDGTIELCHPDTREALNRIILVQSKATLHRFPKETEAGFEWPCDSRDIDHWVKGNTPVVLVVSRVVAGSEEAYWIDVKRYFADPTTRRNGRVAFDKSKDRFDETCSEALMELAAPVRDGLSLGPARVRETLVSNLLRVASHSEHIYVADTEFRNSGAVWAHFKERGIEAGGEWILKGGRILSFYDLDTPTFRGVCDMGTMERHAASDWASSPDLDRLQEFTWLLKQALRESLKRLDVRYDKAENHYHFVATARLGPKDVSYRSLEKLTSRRVFEAYPMKKDPSRTAYYRHSAFRGQFQRYDDRWFLEITPTYRFTADGYRVHPFAGEYLKKIKELEKNGAVLGQVVMWAALLREPPNLFARDYPFLAFSQLETFEIDVGIDEARWNPADEVAAREDILEEKNAEPDLFGGLYDNEG
jgi:hypothetical protein